MNNYPKTSRILHDQFLYKGEIVNFLINRIKKKSKHIDFKTKNIFITGLARSGTTAFLNLIDSTGEFGSFRYKYMPFILSPGVAKFHSKYFRKISSNKTERMHGDGLQISLDSAECLDEPFWFHNLYKTKSFNDNIYPHNVSNEILKSYSYLINRFLNIENKSRFVLKNNNCHLRLVSLSKYFKESKFIILIRNPLDHASSLLNQHIRFIDLQKKNPYLLHYMNLICHWEFGLGKKRFIYNANSENLREFNSLTFSYWINQWILTYRWILDLLNKGYPNVRLVSYDDFYEISSYTKEIFNFLSINQDNISFVFKKNKKNYIQQINTDNKSNLEEAMDLHKKLICISKESFS